jgi:hypothetical protein
MKMASLEEARVSLGGRADAEAEQRVGGRADAEVAQPAGKGERAARAKAGPTRLGEPDQATAGSGTQATPESPAPLVLRTLAVVAPEERGEWGEV